MAQEIGTNRSYISKVVNENIEDEWDGLEVSDRLNYESPIPVNPEQQKILKALNNEKCKYVVVEGPPGTGKTTFAKKGLAKCLIDENGEAIYIDYERTNLDCLLGGEGGLANSVNMCSSDLGQEEGLECGEMVAEPI